MSVVSQTSFTSSLTKLIPQHAPSVSVSLVISAESTNIRKVVPIDSLAGVLLTYANSLDRVWYFSAGIAVPSCVFTWIMDSVTSAEIRNRGY